ncbi:hypothetical protein BDF22DRAFT_698368 [Syncephalis plumigaleata]|nr:hypothetical protein BDF22DRAFT_698368 [Syncephalis plumigaleata]
MALIEGQRPTDNNAAANSQERSGDAGTSHDTSSAPVACADANKTTSTAAADASTADASSANNAGNSLKSPPSPPPYVSLTELPKLSRVFSANAPVTDNTTAEASQPMPTNQMEMTSTSATSSSCNSSRNGSRPSSPQPKNNDTDDTEFDSDATVADDIPSGPGNIVDHSEYARCSLDERRKSMHFKSNDNSDHPKKPATGNDSEAEKGRERPVKILPYTAEILQATIGCFIGVALCGCFSAH